MIIEGQATRALLGRVLSCTGEDGVRYWPRGAVLLAGGTILDAGDRSAFSLPPDLPTDDHGDLLILPGLIDAHIHLPQTQVIASCGAQLIDWLNRFTFPAEAAYGDPAFADAQAEFFLDELLRNGTTSAAVFGSVHRASVEALFAASARRGTRMIAGKVMMDRNAPAALCDDPAQSYADSAALARRWHGRGRQAYAISPRFAVTSSEAQLAAAGRLVRDFPDCALQTHLAENLQEIATVRRLFPDDASYTQVYARHGLLGPRSLLGHCLYLDDRARATMAASGAVAVFCPTSNLFLGSGLFDRARLQAAGVRIAIATDVGGGTSYSMLRTAAEAYKVLQLQGQTLTPWAALYAITRGNAEALGLGQRIGSIAPGFEADLVVLDPAATAAMAHRHEAIRHPYESHARLADELFLLTTLGDDRAVRAVYVAGVRQFPEAA